MKNKKIIVFVIICLVIMLGVFLYFKSNSNIDSVKVQILRVDNLDGKEETINEYSMKKNDTVVLSSVSDYYGCGRRPNDIKILEIAKNSVKISRNKKSYKFIGKYEGKNTQDIGSDIYSLIEGLDFESYTEEIIEDIKYGDKVSFSIDQKSPNSPECSQARYSLFVVFNK